MRRFQLETIRASSEAVVDAQDWTLPSYRDPLWVEPTILLEINEIIGFQR